MLRDVPSAALKQLVKLSERKEVLMRRIQEIDREMIGVESRFGIPSTRPGERAPLTVSRSHGSKSPPNRRGELKQNILRALSSAGGKGLTIRQLSDKLKVPNANLYVWFNSTGKNVPGIRKIGVAHYRLK
jgi:hypothetical protein